MRVCLSIMLIGLACLPAMGQEEKERNWTLSGYMKNLQTGLFFNDFPEDEYLQDNLLHNRLNFSWFPSERWTLRADLRSRAFYGDLVKADPDYADLIDDVNNDVFDWSLVVLDRPSWVIHTMLDRFYLEYHHNDWEIRLGRQRVNWGINTVWNPNDIFNAFAFTDFDYEERPGSDALRIKKYTGFASSVELVARLADSWEEATVAGMWRFNRWNYDFQLLGGVLMEKAVIGGGWAGQIGNAGFKGEWTYFRPFDADRSASFALTLGGDYLFSNGLYLNAGYLYNSNGSTRDNISQLFSFELSAENLYPYRHAVFLQNSVPITPLLNSGLALIYSPVDVHPLFINPSLTLSVATNWDLDLIGQLIFNEQDGRYRGPIQAVFLRIKYSY